MFAETQKRYVIAIRDKELEEAVVSILVQAGGVEMYGARPAGALELSAQKMLSPTD